jgi:hypothetical protein
MPLPDHIDSWPHAVVLQAGYNAMVHVSIGRGLFGPDLSSPAKADQSVFFERSQVGLHQIVAAACVHVAEDRAAAVCRDMTLGRKCWACGLSPLDSVSSLSWSL